MPKHPYVGKPRLVWAYGDRGDGVRSAYVERDAKYRTSRQYTTRETFAVVRPTYNSAGVLGDIDGKYVVTRNAFDEIRSFDDFETAMVYVESLFALEHGG